jgi:D-alanyl-D-alanine carboxypeptidase
MKRFMWAFDTVFLIVFALSLSLSIQAQEESQGEFDAALVDSLQAIIDSAIEQGDPGAVVRIETPQGVFVGVGGYADVEAGIAMQADDAFRVGSLAKTFTSVVILQLMEEGVLTLDDTIAQWLPDVAAILPNSDVITLRHLLTLTSGIHDHADVFIEDFLVNVETQQRAWKPMELVALSASHEADFAPGEDWTYSNINFVLLGMVIEAATDQSAAENYRTRIIEPLELTHTYLADAEEPTVDFVRGYDTYIGTNDYNASWAWTAGALVSNASDLATFIRALLSGDLFTEDSTLETMLTPTDASLVTDYENSYGLGIFITQSPFGAVYGHTGDIFGFHTKVYYFAEFDMVFINLVNTDDFMLDFFAQLGTLAESLFAEPAS